MKNTEITWDLRKKKVTIGDLVGGAVFGRYPDLITGRVFRITPGGGVRIRVEIGFGGYRPTPSQEVFLMPGHFLLLEADDAGTE